MSQYHSYTFYIKIPLQHVSVQCRRCRHARCNYLRLGLYKVHTIRGLPGTNIGPQSARVRSNKNACAKCTFAIQGKQENLGWKKEGYLAPKINETNVDNSLCRTIHIRTDRVYNVSCGDTKAKGYSLGSSQHRNLPFVADGRKISCHSCKVGRGTFESDLSEGSANSSYSDFSSLVILVTLTFTVRQTALLLWMLKYFNQ